MAQWSFICCTLLARALATASETCTGASASSISSKGTKFCSTRFAFDCLGDKEQMQLMAQPIFNNRNAGCHLLKTEAECIGSKDGRQEFINSPCHWCCGQNCTMDNKTSLCEPWEKVRSNPHYIGEGRNGFGESTCPKGSFYLTDVDSYCPCGDDVLSEGQCMEAVTKLAPVTPTWAYAWRDCNYHKLCMLAIDGRNQVYFNKCPPDLTPRAPPFNTFKSICQPPSVPDPDVHVRNTSKPAWADLDKDGDLDLIVGNQYGELQYYERMNDGSLLLREGDHNPFLGIQFGTGAAPAFVDWDDDGDQDLVIGNEDGKLRYYQNIGDNNFVPCTGDTNPFRGIDVGSQAVPTFVDWNRNGYMDLVIGNQDGKLRWYERNRSLSLKAEDESPFNDIDVGFCAAPTFFDWDKDSDLDLIVGNSQGKLLYYEWLLGMFLMRTGEENPFNGIDVGSKAGPSVLHQNQTVFVAIGNEFGGLPHYRRTKVNHLNDRLGISNPFAGVPVGSDAAPAPVDWDNDGDQDLIVGKKDGQLLYFERINENELFLRAGNENPFRDIDVGKTSRPAAVDWNADDYMDMVVGNETGELTYFEHVANNGLLMRPGASNPFHDVKVDGKAAPAFVDWNNDGIWHLVVGSESGELKFYKREDNTLSLLEGDANPFKDITLKSQSAPAFVDWDNDFDLDLVIGNSDGSLNEYSRNGNRLYPVNIDVSPFRFIALGGASKPAFVDWDNDGDMDLIIGGVKSGEGRDGIAYQMNGCPQVNDCNRRGNCQHSGFCLCLDGYRGRGDCGMCNAGLFAAAAPPATLNCERCHPGKYSEEPGDDCSLCIAGRYSPGGRPTCDECQVGRFSEAGQSDCTFCEPGRALHQENSFSGTYTSKHCFCEKGSYANASGGCISCPPKQYCPFDDSDDPKLCPKGSETLDHRTDLRDCRCSKGYGINNNTCQFCQSGRFKDVVDNLECRSCPQTVMQSPIGATNSSNCSCNKGFYYGREGQEVRCKQCNVAGVVCEGGFDNGTQSHVSPYADVDHYLIGEILAVKCRIHGDGTSYCLGGQEKARPCFEGCRCRHGHDGFMCQNCKVGFTRSQYDLSCRRCSEIGPSWWIILVLNLGPIFSSIFYIVIASMAASDQSAPRVHTALLRLWQSWVLSMVCLQNFDFSQIKPFQWSVEQAKAAYLVENPDTDTDEQERFLGALELDIPPWFQGMANTVYGISELAVKIVSPTEIMNCLAERFVSQQDAADYRHYWHAMWWATSPIIVLFWTVVLGLVIVYILIPPLDRRGWFPPSNPIEFRDWAFRLLKPKIFRAIRKLGCEEQDEDEILAEMRVLFGHMDFGFKTLEAVAGNPVGGLGPMMGRLGDEQKERAKRVVFLIFRPKIKRAMEAIATKFFPKSAGGDGAKQVQEVQAFQHPWVDKALLCFWPLLAGIGFDMLVEGCADPVGFVESFTANSENGQMFAVQLLMPAFRKSGIRNGVDLPTLDEVWVNIEEAMSECQLPFLVDVFKDGGAFDSLCKMLMGPPGSIIYIIHKRPEIVEFLASEMGGSLEGDELNKAYKKILSYSGSVELELLMAWSPAQIAVNAMSYNLDGDIIGDKFKAQMEEMREEALRIQNEAVLSLAEGSSGYIFHSKVLSIWHSEPSLWQFLHDTRPVILIALYSMWYDTTKQLLLLNHCDTFAVEDDQGSVSLDQRWAKHANWKCMDWESKHVPVGIISAGGLVVWSLGTLFGLAFLVFRNRHHMAEPAVSHSYTYFVQGYEIQYCWWDVLVKRLDLLCTVVLTYTNFAPDQKAKLFCYTMLSAIVLILHASSKPFDDRKNCLLDRYEYLGLLVRFSSFSLMQLLLIFNPGMYVSITCCAVIGITGTLYFFCIWFTILVEFALDKVNRSHKATADDLEELLDAGIDNTESSSSFAAVTSAAKSLAQVVMNMLLKSATSIDAFYSKMKDGALAIKFGDGKLCMCSRWEQGLEQELKSGSMRMSTKERIKLKSQRGLEAFFHLSDDSQRQYLATTIGAYYVHVLCTMGSDRIPARSLECFLVLSASMKAAKLDIEVKWTECGVEEKCNLMIKGIPSAVQKIRGESQHAQVERKTSMYEDRLTEDDKDPPETRQEITLAAPEALPVSDSDRKGVRAQGLMVTKEFNAEAVEMQSRKMRLHGEELNEALMVLFCVERTIFLDALKLAEDALHKWEDPEFEPENNQEHVEGNDNQEQVEANNANNDLFDALKLVGKELDKGVDLELEPENKQAKVQGIDALLDALKLLKKRWTSGSSRHLSL